MRSSIDDELAARRHAAADRLDAGESVKTACESTDPAASELAAMLARIAGPAP